MAKKILSTSLVLFGLLLCPIAEKCLADAASEFEQAETYKKQGYNLQVEEIYKTITADYPGTSYALKAQRGLVIVYILTQRSFDARDAANNDFHLKSATGRWNGSSWVTDKNTSLCVAVGHPDSDYSNEPTPNGSRINMGAFGNTAEASKSAKYHLVVYLDTDDQEALSGDAQWQLDGFDSTWRNSEEAVLVNAGNYTIKCKCNPGTYYIAPDDLQITVGESQPISYTKTYKECGYLTVWPKYVNTGGCDYLYANWQGDDGEGWRDAGGPQKLLTGTYTISFPYVGGDHITPDSVNNVVVSKGSSQTINRTYGFLLRYVNVNTGSDEGNTGTIWCPLKTIQEAFDQIPDTGWIFVEGPPTLYEEDITFPTSKVVNISGVYGGTITVDGNHSPWPMPSNITCYNIVFE